MPNVLEVQIIGDIQGLDKSLKAAEKLQAEYTASIEKTSKELAENIAISNNYKKAVAELSNEFRSGKISQQEYDKGLQNLKRDEKETAVVTADLRKELSNLKREQKDLGAGFQKDLTPKVANGSSTLLQFSRIAQDAPFGIAGIGNNITATAESFGYLSKQAGGAGAAFKAIGASLVGGGGLLLALSLVTTGLTVMSQKGITVSDVFNKITGDFDEAKAAAKELNEEAVKGSSEQITAMNALVSVAKDVNLSMSDRLIAVKKLQDEYPAYFGNLSNEQILNGNVAGAVEGVTKALIAKAKAAALSSKIAELAVKEEYINSRIEESIAKQTAFYKLSGKEAANFKAVLLKQLRGEIDLVDILEKGNAQGLTTAGKQALAAIQYSGTLRGLSGELKENKKQQDSLTKSTNEAVAAQIKLDTATKKTGKTKKTKAPNVTPQVTVLDSQLKAQDLVDVSSIAVVTGELDEFGNKIKGIAEITPPQIKLRPVETTEFLDSLEAAKQQAKIFSDAVGSSVGAVASQFAQSLQTGNAILDAFTGSLINSFAQIAQAQLTSLITEQTIATAKIGVNQAVSTSNAVTAASSTAAASGPAAAFLLPALVGAAIGFIAASFAGIKFAHGGIVPGGSFTGDKIPAMLNSGEAVLNSQQQANTLMAIANGNSNALQNNRVIDNFDITSVLRGNDIWLSVKRTENKR